MRKEAHDTDSRRSENSYRDLQSLRVGLSPALRYALVQGYRNRHSPITEYEYECDKTHNPIPRRSLFSEDGCSAPAALSEERTALSVSGTRNAQGGA
jgi:hypothetical protein